MTFSPVLAPKRGKVCHALCVPGPGVTLVTEKGSKLQLKSLEAVQTSHIEKPDHVCGQEVQASQGCANMRQDDPNTLLENALAHKRFHMSALAKEKMEKMISKGTCGMRLMFVMNLKHPRRRIVSAWACKPLAASSQMALLSRSQQMTAEVTS